MSSSRESRPLSGDGQALASLLRRAPVSVPPESPVRDVLKRMLAARVGSVVVADVDTGFPLGVLTYRDVLERVVLAAGDLDVPVASVMTGGVMSLPLGANVHLARLLLAQRRLRRVVVVDADGRLAGVVSRGDLYAQRQPCADDLVSRIRAADHVEALRDAARGVRDAAARWLDDGAGAGPVAEWIALLNDLVAQAALDLALRDVELPLVRWCWLAFGSEGRLEQTFETDQDNGLIFEVPDDVDADDMRERFLPWAQRVNDVLDTCGFARCAGGIMAGNPTWCLSVGEWRERFLSWMLSADPEALLNATIFFDFRPLAGDWELAGRLQEWLLARTAESELFLRHMAGNALRGGPPLGRIRDFAVDRKTGRLDLKRDGSRPFVDVARIYALALGLRETATADRLRGAGRLLNWSRREIDAVVEAFHCIQRLRLDRQQRGQGPANLIAPEELNELERATLKEAFRQARKLQARLQIRYQL